jgi:hypothetical protein
MSPQDQPHDTQKINNIFGSKAEKALLENCELSIKEITTTLNRNFFEETNQEDGIFKRITDAAQNDKFLELFEQFEDLKVEVVDQYKGKGVYTLIIGFKDGAQIYLINLPVKHSDTRNKVEFGVLLGDIKVSITKEKILGPSKAEQHFAQYHVRFEQQNMEMLKMLEHTDFSEQLLPMLQSMFYEVDSKRDGENNKDKISEALVELDNLIQGFFWAKENGIPKQSTELLAIIIFVLITAKTIDTVLPGIKKGQNSAEFGNLKFDTILEEVSNLSDDHQLAKNRYEKFDSKDPELALLINEKLALLKYKQQTLSILVFVLLLAIEQKRSTESTPGGDVLAGLGLIYSKFDTIALDVQYWERLIFNSTNRDYTVTQLMSSILYFNKFDQNLLRLRKTIPGTIPDIFSNPTVPIKIEKSEVTTNKTDREILWEKILQFCPSDKVKIHSNCLKQERFINLHLKQILIILNELNYYNWEFEDALTDNNENNKDRPKILRAKGKNLEHYGSGFWTIRVNLGNRIQAQEEMINGKKIITILSFSGHP